MKKISIIFLAIILSLTIMPMTASAADNMVDHIDFEALGDYIGRAATDPEHTRPGDEIIIPLLYEGFRDSSNSLIDWGEKPEYGPKVSQLKREGINPHLVIAKGAEYVRDVTLVNYTPTPKHRTYTAIRIRFVEELVSTQEFQYQFSLQMYVNKRGNTVTLETFGGRFSNETFEAYNSDKIYTGDGIVVKSVVPIVNMQLDMGNGVTTYVDTISNERYYGIAKHFDNTQDKLSEAYPQITEVYDIKSVNVKPTNAKVKIEGFTKSDALYVYNVAGNYVGMSNELLPYANRYYLSTEAIEIDPNLVDLKLNIQEDRYNEKYPSSAVIDFNQGLKKAQGLLEAPKEY